ncbi:hypothetical protein CQR51_0948, partial [Bifidobacterium pseudolongum subsp. globosum]|uniref:hypothetical protein n=1 Tax=Bifidobacterium pseudolongum TaxID=1694 RepID=UPI000CBDF67D
MIHNLAAADPGCTETRGTWCGSHSADGAKWKYMLEEGQSNGTLFAWKGITSQQAADHVLYARVTSESAHVLDVITIENCRLIAREHGWVAGIPTNDNSHTLPLVYGALTLQEVAMYTPDDWDKILAMYTAGILPSPWIDGEYLRPGGGQALLAVIHALSGWRWRHDTQPAAGSILPRPAKVEPIHECHRGSRRRPADLFMCGCHAAIMGILRAAAELKGAFREDTGIGTRIR